MSQLLLRRALDGAFGGSPILQASGCVQINLISGQDVSLNDKLEEFWKVESYGTAKNVTNPMSVEDQLALNWISDSVCNETAITRWISCGRMITLCFPTTEYSLKQDCSIYRNVSVVIKGWN